MWNSLMANAKAMAADLDSKLTESVGIGDDGKPLAETTPPKETLAAPSPATPAASATKTASVAPSAATPGGDGGGGGGNDDGAWNDDFDFDDDDDAIKDVEISGDAETSKPTEAAPPQTTIPEKKKADPIPASAAKTESQSKSVPKESTPQSKQPLDQTSTAATTKAASGKIEPKDLSPSSKKETISTPTKPSLVVSENETKTPQPPSTPAVSPPVTDCTANDKVDTPAVDVAGVPVTKEDENKDGTGWDGDDDMDIDVEEDTKVTDTGEKVVVDDSGTSPTKVSDAAKTTPKVGVTTPAAVTTAKTPAAVTTPVSGGGGLFSNLSNLAKTADKLLTPVAKPGELAEMATSSEKKADDTKDTAKASTNDELEVAKEESEKDSAIASSPAPAVITTESDRAPAAPVVVSTPVAAIPTPKKFTPGGGLFSNLSNLAKTADSLLTAAVTGDEAKINTNNPTESGWDDEDGDDAFFDDDDDDLAETKKEEPTKVTAGVSNTAVVSEEKGKTEESSSSFVKVSPTSSISTPEVLPPKSPIPQENDTGKDSSGQTSSPLPKVAVSEVAPGSSSTIPVAANIEDDPRFKKLQETLRMREEQLIDKGRQLNDLQLMIESREEQYKKKLQDTKDEAKKRIMRAKERCEAAEGKLQAKSAGDSDDLKKKQSIIDELMEEGQALAQKQSRMERAVREATAETRGLREEVQNETHAKEQALSNIKVLEAECKSLKESLVSARKGESQAGKLENDLLSARALAEEKANTILSLQQRMKELAAGSKELQREIDDTRKSAAHEAQQEKTSMRREHNDLIGELEQKLRTTEREAGVREDALRHEVSEIRKRWQDAVRRADALNMDIQSSTAPLMRQLESMERQNRLRTTNAAELESKLRSDLEEATIENERIYKETSDLKSKLSKFERSIKERDQDLSKAQTTLEEQARDLETLRKQEKKLLAEAETRQTEYERVERLANEGVARVRSEMSQTVTDSEERYRGQIEKLQKQLVVETEKRSQLEAQVNQLLESGSGIFAATRSTVAPPSLGIWREETPKKLRKAEGQAEILAGALGLDSDSDSESESDDDAVDGREGDGLAEGEPSSGSGLHSFAAIEQLSSKLKTAEIELESLRKSLEDSNATRQSLAEELGESRQAKEKLPLFEAKVKELTQQNREMELEIAGLKDDIADVRELYRTQLNVLLEEKTASAASEINEKKKQQPPASEKQTPASEDKPDDKTLESVESMTLPSSPGMVLL